jgi:hypothetical protein
MTAYRIAPLLKSKGAFLFSFLAFQHMPEGQKVKTVVGVGVF